MVPNKGRQIILKIWLYQRPLLLLVGYNWHSHKTGHQYPRNILSISNTCAYFTLISGFPVSLRTYIYVGIPTRTS